MEFQSLREEIIWVTDSVINSLKSVNSLAEAREKEIREFLQSRFDGDYSFDLLEMRLNEMMTRFEELYIPLAEIKISKYKK